MRILDIYGNELVDFDISKGRIRQEEIEKEYHPEVIGVDEQWHYEVIREYPNGGKDLIKIVDREGVEHKDGWMEYEEIIRFIPYTEEELASIPEDETKVMADKIRELEEALALLLSGETQ